jgi:hypothetical protein
MQLLLHHSQIFRCEGLPGCVTFPPLVWDRSYTLSRLLNLNSAYSGFVRCWVQVTIVWSLWISSMFNIRMAVWSTSLQSYSILFLLSSPISFSLCFYLSRNVLIPNSHFFHSIFEIRPFIPFEKRFFAPFFFFVSSLFRIFFLCSTLL